MKNPLLEPHGLRRITVNTFELTCESLSGLRLRLVFQYECDCGRRRFLLKFYQLLLKDMRCSYDTFQRHLETTFGDPSTSEETEDGFMYHTWQIGDCLVSHSVIDRFGLCETVAVTPPFDSARGPGIVPRFLIRMTHSVTFWFTFERFLLPRLLLIFAAGVIAAFIALSRVQW